MTWVRYQETMQLRSEFLIEVPGEVKGDDAIAAWIEQHLDDRRRTSYSDPAEGDVDFEFLDYDVPPATVRHELAELEQALAAFGATLEGYNKGEEAVEDSEQNGGTITFDTMARAAAQFTTECMSSRHRGLIDCRDKVVIFGNDGYDANGATGREVTLVREHVETLGLHADGFGLSDDGYTWAIVVSNYRRLPLDLRRLEAALYTCHGRACDEAVSGAS